jgi:hypothetical protein
MELRTISIFVPPSHTLVLRQDFALEDAVWFHDVAGVKYQVYV